MPKHPIGPQPTSVEIEPGSPPDWLAGIVILSARVRHGHGVANDMALLLEAAAALEAALPNWHLQSNLPYWYTAGHPFPHWAEAGLSLGLSPRLNDPRDLAERGMLGAQLSDALSAPGVRCHTPFLLDWAIAPILGPRIWGPKVAERQAQAALYRAARRPLLQPYIEGHRLLRNRQAFVAFHAELSELQAVLLTILIESRALDLTAVHWQPYRAVFDDLAAGNWISIVSSHGRDVAQRALNANRLLGAELLQH